MHHRLLLLFTGLFLGLCAFAQNTTEVYGRVTDSTGAGLEGITIKLRAGTDSTGGVTGKNGFFTLRLPHLIPLTLEISGIGYLPFSKTFDTSGTVVSAGEIRLLQQSTVMPEVIVTSINPIKIKEDTVEYKADAYKVREGAPVEDVVKKLPGVTVEKDGKVTAHGKPVVRVRVNGKDFFGGDAQTALQNLPADIIDNIQIIDDYGDQANLTGIKSDDPEKIININTRKDKNKGQFGSITAAAGTDDRYAAGIMANDFRDERQLSFLGAINNTNTNLFNFNSGGKGGGARGANFGGAERGGSGGNGITLSRSLGFNYRNNWGKKISVNGSYSYSSRNTTTLTNSLQKDINPLNIRSTARNSESRSGGSNHRATFNLEYRIDSVNFVKISPFVSLSSSGSANHGRSAITRTNYYTLNNSQSQNESTAPNSGTDLTFNHKFRKRGRNLNVFASISYSYRDQDSETKNQYANDDSTYIPVLHKDTIQQQQTGIINRNIRTVARLSYTEPLVGRMLLELNYEWNRSATSNMKQVDDIDPVSGDAFFNDVQSNHFDYQFVTNRIGLNIKGGKSKYSYVVGIISQPSSLRGQSIGKGINTNYHNANWIPSARFVYTFTRNHTLTMTYSGNSREPDFMQLQPVSDSSNLNNIVIGNPNLQAELTRKLALQYNKFDTKTGRSLFTNLSFDQTNDKIVTSRANNPSGTGRTTSYLNTDGFYHINANGSLTRPFSNRKFSATVSMSADYNNNISYTDNQRTRGSNWNLRPAAALRIDLDERVDASLNANYTFYETTTRYPGTTNTTRARTLNIGVNGKNYFKDLTIGYDFTRSINYGFSSNVKSNPIILSLYAEYRFLKGKRTTIKLQGYDLFNENTGITRTINETTITDSRSNRLARYFLLTFNYRMQKFGGNARGNSGRHF